MGWETRNGSGRYYTRSRRVDGRVVREYIGIGLAAQIEYADMLDRREEAEIESESIRSQQQLDKKLDQTMIAFEQLTEGIARGTLLVNGYYRHHRGEWRRKRK